MAPHWKCGSGQPVGGSNPPLSAIRPTSRGAVRRRFRPADPITRQVQNRSGYEPVPAVGSGLRNLAASNRPNHQHSGPSFVDGSVARNTLTGPRRRITPRHATALDAADSGRAISPLVCAGHREPRVDPESGPHRPLHYPGQYRGGSPGRRLTDAHSPTTIRRGRARRGTSGALHPQSATAGLNSRPRSLASASHSIARR